MKNIVGLFFSLKVLFSSLIAQENRMFEFMGTLQMPDDIIITYKINFQLKANGDIEGYSLTDFYGENRTKSKITGHWNEEGNKISFDETENLSTKSTSNVDEFCFIHLKNGKIKTMDGKSVLQGNFKGKYLNGKNCVDGYMYLMGTDFIDFLCKKFLNDEVIKNKDSLKLIKQKYTELVKKQGETHLSANNNFKMNWNSEEVILEIWDAMEEDKDEINIFINQKKVLENYVIRQERKVLVVPFTESTCIIKIVAVTEGSTPPNTVNIILRDGEVLTPLVTDLKMGEKASIQLERKRH